MKQRNRILSLMLAILLVVGMVPISAIAADIGETYTLTLVYNHEIYGGATVDTSIDNVVVENIPNGTIVDLSDYWPDNLSVTGNDGKTYYFCNFLTNPKGGTIYYNCEVKSDMTLYAAWIDSPWIAVTFDVKGGSMDYKKAVCQASELVGFNQFYVPVRNGYKFLGWSLEDDGTADDPTTEITKNCTLYAVWEEVHSHCVCGGNTNIGDHTSHSDIEFTPWNSTSSMPTSAGHYVLMNNVTLSSGWEPADGTVLCLNGHTLYTTCVDVKHNNQFTLCDCGNGMITASDGNSSDVIYLYAGSIFNMYGGEISVSKGQQGVTVINAAFNMYGGSIVGNYSEGATGGGGVGNKGSFTMYNGIITGNKCGDPGSGVENHGTFIMNGGSITKNQSSQNAGGGVYNSSYATFAMNGGTVTNNSSKESGGGVQNDYIFVMTGGEIIENTSINSTGGGVWSATEASVSISGDAVITGNTGKDGTNNLHLASDGTTDAKIAVGRLGSNASIGVSVDSNHGMVISEGGKDHKDKFFSDNGAYTVAVDGEDIELLEKTVQVGMVTLGNGEYTTDGEEKTPGEPKGEGYAYFKDGVLTLNNFTYTGKGAPENVVIYAAETLEIKVVGTNTINTTNGSAMNFDQGYVIDGNGILNLTGSPVCIVGHSQYPAQIKNITLNAVAQFQVLYVGKFSIENAKLNLTSEDVSSGVVGGTIAIKNSEIISNSGIDATLGDLEVENSKIVVSDDIALSVNAGHTVKLIGGDITISGNGGDEGAIYVRNSTLAMPEVDYWWRTSADGNFTKNGFVYDKQDYIEITTTDPHTCDYTYNVNAYTITESCTCGHTATAEIVKDYDGTAIYNGKAYGAKVVYSDNWAGDKVTELKYYKEQINDGNLVTNCIDAGDYLAVLTVEGATAEWSFTISQKEPVISMKPTVSNIVVNSTLSDVSLNGGTVLGIGDAELEGEFSWKEPTAVMGTVGPQTVKVVFTPEDKNYSVKTFDLEVNVVNCDTASGEHDFTEWENNDTEHWLVCAKCKAEKPDSREAHKGGTATCTAKANCSVCNEEYGDYGAHNWDTKWTTDSEKHWHKCLNTSCTEIKDDNAHSGGTATCMDKAKCEFCDVEYGEPDGDNHKYSATLTWTDDEHFYECSLCSAKKDKALHDFTDDCDETCNTCGYERTVSHTFDKLEKDSDGHWYICSVCGTPSSDGKEAHSGGAASCTAKAKCTECGEEYGNYGEHNWDTNWTSDSNKHWHKCLNSECTEIKDENAHSGGTATCKDKAKCEFCDTAFGELGAHGDTEVKDAKDATCAVPGYTGNTYCTVCNQKISEGNEIAATGHLNKETRNKKDATCTEKGYTGDIWCTDCNTKLETGTDIAALGHNYENGKCKVCGTADPNYKPTTNSSDDSKSPQTGDNSNVALWFALLIISSIGLAGTAIYGRKKRNQA